MKEVKVEVMGSEPPCVRCQSVKRAVDKVAHEFAQNGIWVHVERIAPARIVKWKIVIAYALVPWICSVSFGLVYGILAGSL